MSYRFIFYFLRFPAGKVQDNQRKAGSTSLRCLGVVGTTSIQLSQAGYRLVKGRSTGAQCAKINDGHPGGRSGPIF